MYVDPTTLWSLALNVSVQTFVSRQKKVGILHDQMIRLCRVYRIVSSAEQRTVTAKLRDCKQ